MRVRLAGALVLVTMFTMALPALWAQRSNGPAYNQSRTPTPNQLLAACHSEFLSFSPNDIMSANAWPGLAGIMDAPTSDLLSGVLVDSATRSVCSYSGQCGPAKVLVKCFVDRVVDGRTGRFRTPTMTVKDYIDGNTQGRQDPQGYASSPARTGPTPRPNVAAKAAPQVATNLPKARPERTAPWSPQAMSIDPTEPLDPKYAPDRADALASCSATIQRFAALEQSTVPESNLTFEQAILNDRVMEYSTDLNRQYINNIDARINSGQDSARSLAMYAAFKCLVQRRISQLEGSPLIPGAVDGSLNPLSIGGVTPPWKQQGKDKRTIAGDGKSAMHCVSLETIASGDSNTSAAVKGRVIVNNCSDEVEINWCNSPGECERESGNTWTVQPGYSWPVSSEGEVRWSACHGANTTSTVKGSYGLRYYCNAPLVESKRSRKR